MSLVPPFSVTTDAPHASAPTHEATVRLYRISRGPRRTFSRLWPGDPQHQLYVPPLDTWTPELLERLLQELVTFMPEQQDAFEAVAFVYVDRDRVHVDAETTRCGAGIDVPASALSDPMRAAITALPSTARPGGCGMPISRLVC